MRRSRSEARGLFLGLAATKASQKLRAPFDGRFRGGLGTALPRWTSERRRVVRFVPRPLAIALVLSALVAPSVAVGAPSGRTCDKFWCRVRPEIQESLRLERAMDRLERADAGSEDIELFRRALTALGSGKLVGTAELRLRVLLLALELEIFPRDRGGLEEAYLSLGALLAELRELGARSVAHFERARIRAHLGGDPRPELEQALEASVNDELRERILLSLAVVNSGRPVAESSPFLAELVARSRYRTTRALAAFVLARGAAAEGNLPEAGRWLRTGETEWAARAAASSRPPWSELALGAEDARVFELLVAFVEGRSSCGDSSASDLPRGIAALFACDP